MLCTHKLTHLKPTSTTQIYCIDYFQLNLYECFATVPTIGLLTIVSGCVKIEVYQYKIWNFRAATFDSFHLIWLVLYLQTMSVHSSFRRCLELAFNLKLHNKTCAASANIQCKPANNDDCIAGGDTQEMVIDYWASMWCDDIYNFFMALQPAVLYIKSIQSN